MTRSRGLFIVVEGIDGVGTTTQAQMLDRFFHEHAMAVLLTREPTDAPVGRLIRAALSGEGDGAHQTGRIALTEEALCLLFAADRVQHSREIESLRDEGTHVVSDRYVLSSIAYQSFDPGITPERVIDVNRAIAVPDVTFLLEAPVDECLKRLERRNDSPTVYEKKETLTRIAQNYTATRSLYEKHFGTLIPIDGTAQADAVHSEIVAKLSGYLGE